MNSKNFYELFEISEDATIEEIENAYNDKIAELYILKNTGALDREVFDKKLGNLIKAHDVLVDEKSRADYDEYLAQKRKSKKSKVKSKDKDKDKDAKKSGKGIAKKVATGAVCAALAVSVLAAGYFGVKHVAGLIMNDDRPVQSQTQDEGSIIPDSNGTITPDAPDGTETPDIVDFGNLPPMVNYGNINDAELLNTRATNLVNQLNAAGLYNMATNAPYTVEEIKEVALYMNGEYKPENEVDAMRKVDDFLNLVIAPLNSETFIYTVNYQGGNDEFKPIVEEHANNFKRVNFVDNLLFGDSTVGPYLKWLEDQYCAMQTTTDREECNRIYNSVLQSLADFSFGNGFELDGKVYTESMALGLDKVNSGNMLQFLVYIIEPFRTYKANDYYTITDKYLSLDPELNKVAIPYLQITEWYTPLCDTEDYEFDDEGYLIVDQRAVPEVGIEADPQEGHNFASINQMNTVNALLEKLYGKGYTSNNALIK